jgi:hypothetical protein
MRYMMIVKANKQSEAGVMPTEELLSEMGKFNEEMVKAGMLIDAAGLESSAKGARVKWNQGKQSVVNGPFPNTEELIAGFWIVRAKSLDEVTEWTKRVPFKDGEVEIRRLFDLEDFDQGPAIEQARELGKQMEKQKVQ